VRRRLFRLLPNESGTRQRLLFEHDSKKKNRLSPQQAVEAERLYWRAYQIMAYGNKNAYHQALILFKKVQQIAPDEKFSFYIKAQEKSNLVMQNLAMIENQQKPFSDSSISEK
jgi:hypothetical protein